MLTSKTFLKYSLFIWLGLIWLASSLPGKTLPQVDVLNFDKLAHVVVYFILGVLLFKNHNQGLFRRFTRQQLLLIAIILAALDEAHQFFIPNRLVSVYDLAANLAGLTLSYFTIKPKPYSYD